MPTQSPSPKNRQAMKEVTIYILHRYYEGEYDDSLIYPDRETAERYKTDWEADSSRVAHLVKLTAPQQFTALDEYLASKAVEPLKVAIYLDGELHHTRTIDDPRRALIEEFNEIGRQFGHEARAIV